MRSACRGRSSYLRQPGLDSASRPPRGVHTTFPGAFPDEERQGLLEAVDLAVGCVLEGIRCAFRVSLFPWTARRAALGKAPLEVIFEIGDGGTGCARS